MKSSNVFKKLITKEVQQMEYRIYIMIFFVYLIINRIIPITYLITGVENSILASLLAIGGVFLLVQDLSTERILFKVKYYWVGIIYISIMAVSSLLNIKYGMFNNVKTMVWFSIQFFLFYIFFKKIKDEAIRSYTKKIFFIFNIIWSLASIFSIVQYMFQIEYMVRLNNGLTVRQGFCENRLFGIFSDPNTASIASVCLIAFLFYIFINENLFWKKIIYGINIFIHYSYIILSGSRTSIICMLVVTFIETLFIGRNVSIRKKRDLKKSIIKIVIMIIVSMLLVISTYIAGKKLLSYLPMVSKIIKITDESTLKIIAPNSLNDISLEELSNQEENINVNETEEILEREDVKKDNYLNNRVNIWKGYLQSLKGSKWVFGLSPRNAIAYIQEKYPENYVALTGYIPHSEYIGVVAYTGITGAFTIIVFICLLIGSVIKKLSSTYYLDEFYIMSLAILVALGVYGIVFTDILFCNNLSGIVFWIALSVVLNYDIS